MGRGRKLPPEILAASKAAEKHKYDTSKYAKVDLKVRMTTKKEQDEKDSRIAELEAEVERLKENIEDIDSAYKDAIEMTEEDGVKITRLKAAVDGMKHALEQIAWQNGETWCQQYAKDYLARYSEVINGTKS